MMHDIALILWRLYRPYLLLFPFFLGGLVLSAIGDTLRLFRAYPIASGVAISIALWCALAFLYYRPEKRCRHPKQPFDGDATREWMRRIWAGE